MRTRVRPLPEMSALLIGPRGDAPGYAASWQGSPAVAGAIGGWKVSHATPGPTSLDVLSRVGLWRSLARHQAGPTSAVTMAAGQPPGGVGVPELPEVERGRRLAESVAAGRRIDRVWCDDDPIVFDQAGPRRWRRALEGKRVNAARRWGKQLWLEMEAPPHPLFHFGMTGGFRTPAAVPLQLKSGPREDSTVWPPRFAKIRIHLDDGGELAMTDGRRLGRILLRDDPEHELPIARLGFDPLLAMPPPRGFSEMLRARTGNVKSLLLDQSFAAGVGNWIADECSTRPGSIPGAARPR